MQKTAFLGVAKRLPGCRSLILGILRGQIFTIHNCRTASKLQGMVLILNAATVIARNKVTKQSKYEIPRFARNDRKKDCYTEPALNEVNVFAMTIQHCGDPVAIYWKLSS